METPGLIGKKCVVCGKEFYPAYLHRFRRETGKTVLWYCTWPCYLRGELKTKERKRAGKDKPVECYDKSGDLLHVYLGANAAAEALGCCSDGVRKCCRGEVSTYYGYVWKYKEGNMQ